jgi:intein-encoded DNA endonuclease-like protein
MLKYNSYKTESVQEIISLYNAGKNTVEIAKLFGTYNTTIRRILLRNNIVLRTFSEVRSRAIYNRFESSILSDEESYFLGLLITDGCISKGRLTLGLQESDVFMLELFAKFLGPEVKVNKYFHKKHQKLQYEVKVRNLLLLKNLQKLGNFHNKSYDAELYIPINFSLLRGIIDGDGSVNKCNKSSAKIQIFGKSFRLIKQIEGFLHLQNISPIIKINKQGVYILSVYKQKDVLYLYNNMYISTDLCLIRKKHKFGPLLEKSRRVNSVNSGNFCQES